MCLEVAEHLSTDRAEALVQDLCRLAPVVFFGAAIPGQGGDDHINEQWQSYWAALFKQNEYLPYDTVRPKVWCNAEVEYFYRQNPLLYVHESAAYLVKTIFPCTMISVIHPICYATHSRPSPRNLIRKFPGAIGQAIRRRIRL
jgi:hypothetical protein